MVSSSDSTSRTLEKKEVKQEILVSLRDWNNKSNFKINELYDK